MKKKVVTGIMLTLLVLSMLTFAFNVQPVISEPATIVVPDDYPTIQEAINAASPGDTIYVYNGTYYENVVVDKSIQLIGEDPATTIIDGSGTGNVVYVTVDHVEISGFTVQNGGSATFLINYYTVREAGIFLHESSYCKIMDCELRWNGFEGISIAYYSEYNIIANCSAYSNGGTGIGFGLWPSHNVITNCNASFNNASGISVYDWPTNVTITNCTASWNSGGGIHLGWNTESLIENCTANGNDGFGILLDCDKYCTAANCYAGSNAYDGIRVYAHYAGFEFNTITNCEAESNQWCGIAVVTRSGNLWSQFITIKNCDIHNNERGIHVTGNGSKIYHNNLIDNAILQASDNGGDNVWDDGYPSGGNYWSDYKDRYPNATELNDSGIWDTPYEIDENNQDNYPLMEPWTRALVRSTRYPWSMFRHDLRHTGYTESPAPNTNQTQWNYTTGDDVWSSPVVVDGMVFIGSNDGNVYALDQHTGSHIWNYTTGGPVESPPAVADGKVFVGSYDAKVYCLDASTGAHVWNYTTGWAVHSSPAVSGGKVYVGSFDGKVYCLRASDGFKEWEFTTGDGVISSPAVSGGKVYVGSFDGKVYCLDASTGAHIWNYTTGSGVYSSPAVADGKVFVGSYDAKVYCLDASTGAHVWNYTTGSEVYSSPAVSGGKVYVGSFDGKVYCLDASTGAHIWNYTTQDWVHSSPAVADGKVFVGSYDAKVYCLDASTGAHIWNYTTGSGVYSSPAVADGMVFVGSNDHAVYAFGNVIRVPEDYPTMQEAIEAAEPEATIIIAPGTYNESLVIDKPLTIIGKKGSAPIFDGGGSGIAVTLLPSASGTTIAGIVITNWDQGILILDSSDCKIYDNIMYLNLASGIVLEGNNAINNLIYSNIFQDNTIAINLTASSTSNTVYKNIISQSNIGLSLESDGNVIYANIISGNDVGIDMSSSNGNVIYHNNFIDNTYQIESASSVNVWDNGYPSGGNYWNDFKEQYPDVEDVYSGSNQDEPGSDGIWDQPYIINENNTDRYPLVKHFNPHDIGIPNVVTSKTIVGQDCPLKITLTIINYGVYDETFSVTAYANTTVIATYTSTTLTSASSTIVAFTWNTTGVAKGNYTISAYATPVDGETDLADNNFIDGMVLVTFLGDVNGDGKVRIDDVRAVAKRFGTDKGGPPNSQGYYYDSNCDINDDDKIRIDDVRTVARHFGEGP